MATTGFDGVKLTRPAYHLIDNVNGGLKHSRQSGVADTDMAHSAPERFPTTISVAWIKIHISTTI